MEYYSEIKKITNNTYKTFKLQNHYAEQLKPVTKDCLLYDFTYMKFFCRRN